MASPKPVWDVVVAGAGPAGSAAAVTLGRLGRTVALVDRAVFPRDKCCGDGLTAAALRRVERLGLDPGAVPSWQPVDTVVVVTPGGDPIQLPLPAEGLFAVTARRAELDAALVDLARRGGADVMEGATVTGVHPVAGAVAVEVDGGPTLLGRYVIAADGMWSPVRRSLGLSAPGYLGEWQAGRQYLGGTGPAARKLWVWFEPDMLPGYAWSFPLPGGGVNFGYGVRRGGHPGLRGQRIDWTQRPAIAEVLGDGAHETSPWRAWPIPARIGSAPLSGLDGRVLFVGDAAGACDPMTGEGIAQALETGELAARALAQSGPDRPGSAAIRYSRQVRAGLAVDDRLSRALSRVLARPDGPARALSLVDSGEWSRRNFARWMFEDYPRALLVTPHRWRRGAFTRPGAYRDRRP